MKKSLILSLFFAVSAWAADQGAQEMLKGLGESGGMAGGAMGIGVVHAIFWVPVLIFVGVVAMVFFFYLKQFKQKEDGLFKTLGALVLGVVLGVILYAGCLKIVDSALGEELCGKEIIRAYLKDSIKKGLNPSVEFGESIKSVSCLN